MSPRNLLAGAGCLLLAGVIAMEIYTRQPTAVLVPDLNLPAEIASLTLIFHGSVDGDNPQFPAIAARLWELAGDDAGHQVRYVRWDPWSDQRLRAAATARRLGGQLGSTLAAMESLQLLRLVAHSSGSYVPDALCEAYRAGAARPARVEMVFLDPFQIRGFLDWSHGARTHGRCADFALALFNTDDPAPATNRPLARAFNIDVTAHPARAGFPRNGHYWPVQYYLEFLPALAPGPGGLRHEFYPRGTVLTAPVHPGVRIFDR